MTAALALRAPDASEHPVFDRLEAARSAIEGRFLEVGDVLSRAVDGVGSLISALDRMRASLDGDVVAATVGELAGASDTLRSLPDGLRVRREQLGGLVRMGDGLAGAIEDMRQHLAYLRVFAINIKITSGGIAAAGEEFAIFAQEISDCIELGRRQLDAFQSDLETLESALHTALEREDDLGRRCGDLLPAVPDALMTHAEAIAAHQAKLNAMAGQIGDLARQVRKKVGSALAALQIGDITRQRIEHVQAGLAALEASSEVAALEPEARARAEAFMRQLLAAQLMATVEDFHREVSRIGENVAGMAGDAGEMLRLRDHAQGRSSDGEGSFLRGLETSVTRALGLVDDIEAGERVADEVSRSAAEAARSLAAQVAGIQTMRADVQMMGLNTTLKCSRIGDTGKPLAVIAMELRQHAIQLEGSAARAQKALEALSIAADANGREVESRDEDRSASAAAAVLGEAVGRIRKAGDEAEGDLATAARTGGEVVDMLRRAAGRFDFQRQVGGYLDEAVGVLADLAGDDAVAVDDLGPVLHPLLGDLYRSYTMVQEREVHNAMAAAVGDAPDAVVATPEPPAVVDDDDDMLF